MAGASAEEAASPEKPQEVSFAGAFLLKENDTVFFNSEISIWFFFFPKLNYFPFVSSMFLIGY